MKDCQDYRSSHTAESKGSQYDKRFREFAWRKYLWKNEQAVLARIVEEYFAGRSIRYLDFACGTGRIIRFMKDRVTECTGIDVSESMLNQCRRKLPDTEIIQGDITRDDPLGDRKFDLITTFRFFPNAQQELREEVIQALAEHLTDDGLLVFNNHRNKSSVLFTLGRIVKRNLACMSNSQVDGLVSTGRLEIEKVFSIGVLPGYDNHPMILPSVVHRTADWLINNCRIGRTLCQDNIFVCRRTESHQPKQEAFEIPNREAVCA